MPPSRMRDMRYFNPSSFELDGRLYEMLGVRQFKRFASAGDFFNQRRRRSDPGFRNVKNYSSSVEWEARTRFNELAHLCNLIFSLVMVVWLCLHARYTWIGAILFLNLLLNVYPIMLQRYNRGRIQRIRFLRQTTASKSGQTRRIEWAKRQRMPNKRTKRSAASESHIVPSDVVQNGREK
jgi:hypothetical protein